MTLTDVLQELPTVLAAFIGAGAALLGGRAQRADDRRRDDETRARTERQVRAYFAALATDLHEVVELQTRTGGIWHQPAIDRPFEALRSLYEDSELVLRLEPSTIHAVGRALADLRIATTSWKILLERDDDADRKRETFKSLFRGPKAALATALDTLGADPARATYAARAESQD